MIIPEKKKNQTVFTARMAHGGVADELKAIAQDFIDAVNSNDAEGLAHAFEAAFDHCEMQPHEEYGESEEQE